MSEEYTKVELLVEKGNAPFPGPRGDEDRSLWFHLKAFHGHECNGTSIGYRAALYAKELLSAAFSKDEEIVCISENDACGCDAIQVILGCTIGKGNFLFHLTGKSAYNFFSRESGKGIRLVLKPTEPMDKTTYFHYLQTKTAEELFDVKEPKITCPPKARIYENAVCAICGEKAGLKWMTEKDGRFYCADCSGK
ncbi:MAG: formylmethanofuran dehydrogenase [Spirochaetales bacterium]|nr:formylmethanofuran dehydrogenase [Candidatus Physcosoma equi]